MRQADNSVKNWQNLPYSNPKPALHNINAHTKFDENPLTYTKVIVRKWKYGLQMGEHMDNQRETIIPQNYHVTGYKNFLSGFSSYLELQTETCIKDKVIFFSSHPPPTPSPTKWGRGEGGGLEKKNIYIILLLMHVSWFVVLDKRRIQKENYFSYFY